MEWSKDLDARIKSNEILNYAFLFYNNSIHLFKISDKDL